MPHGSADGDFAGSPGYCIVSESCNVGPGVEIQNMKRKGLPYPLDLVVHAQGGEFRALVEEVAALAFGTALWFLGLKQLVVHLSSRGSSHNPFGRILVVGVLVRHSARIWSWLADLR